MKEWTVFLPKARELFRERHIDWSLALAAESGEPVPADPLLDLQARIYALDDLLERCWQPAPAELDLHWRTIGEAPVLDGMPGTERQALLRGLGDYLQQELSVRRGERLCDIPIGDFYFRKTCDVRLARDLIHRAAPRLETLVPRAAWEPLDRLTEVEDDLADREEDSSTFNGNRLLSAQQHRPIEVWNKEYADYARALAGAGNGIEPLEGWLQEALRRVLALIGEESGSG